MFFKKKKYWRINLSWKQIEDEGVTGADEFRDKFFSRGPVDKVAVNWAVDQHLEKTQIRKGDNLLITAVGDVKAGESSDRQHLAIATAVFQDFEFNRVTSGAKIYFDKFIALNSEPKIRTMEKPKKNITPLASVDIKRFF